MAYSQWSSKIVYIKANGLIKSSAIGFLFIWSYHITGMQSQSGVSKLKVKNSRKTMSMKQLNRQKMNAFVLKSRWHSFPFWNVRQNKWFLWLIKEASISAIWWYNNDERTKFNFSIPTNDRTNKEIFLFPTNLHIHFLIASPHFIFNGQFSNLQMIDHKK